MVSGCRCFCSGGLGEAEAVRRLAFFCLVTALATASCVGPIRDFQGYRAKAWHGVETASSAVEATIFGVRDALRNQAFAPYLSVSIRDAEEDASTAQSQFASIQPPDAASDKLRATVSSVLADASDTVSRARIAMRRGDIGTMGELEQALDHVAKRLDQMSARLQP